MCSTCIYRTDDREFLALPRHNGHPCHEDEFGGINPFPKLCYGNKGERGTHEGRPMFADKWEREGYAGPIMNEARRLQKERHKGRLDDNYNFIDECKST